MVYFAGWKKCTKKELEELELVRRYFILKGVK